MINELDAPESICRLNDAIQEAFEDEKCTNYDIALALCIALYFCGDFGTNVKLLADVDEQMAEEEQNESAQEKYDA